MDTEAGVTPVMRHVVALPRGGGRVALAWRLLATDAHDAAFHVERRQTADTADAPAASEMWQRITGTPITDSTTFIDHAPTPATFEYRLVDPANACSETASVHAGAAPTCEALHVPLPPGDEPEDPAIGRLIPGDPRFGFVVKVARRNSIWLTAFDPAGRSLWEFNTHLPRHGGWDGSMRHAPIVCWDTNADGRTEVLCHAYPGDDLGPYPAEKYDQAIDGETLTCLDGQTGDIVWQAPWPATVSRVMMTIGCFDAPDAPAHIVVQDETYGHETLTAIDGRDGTVTWRVKQERAGGHNLDVADIDDDGRQEVICGGVCYNPDSSIRWQAEPFGHTDISKPGRYVPGLPGMQTFFAVEKLNQAVYLVDKDGHTLWKEKFRHAHYGWIARHAPNVPGLHPHAAEDARQEYGAADQGMREVQHNPIFLPDGSHWMNLTEWQRKRLFPVHWDGGPTVTFAVRKENQRVVRLHHSGDIEDPPDGKLPDDVYLGLNTICADVMGDYRENLVSFRPIGSATERRYALSVLSNPAANPQRGRSPMDHFEYRHDRSQFGSGYYRYISPPITTV